MAAVSDPAKLEDQVRESTRHHYGELSRVLQQGQVQVANMSLGFGVSMSLENALRSVGFVSRVLFRDAITRMIATIMRVQQEELRRFFQENPTTIFVVAAGNDGVDVARPGDYHSAAVGGPNVVNVAATDFNGRLAEFSNTSTQEIEIAAPGVVVRSSLARAGDTHARVAMSGTSMATPIVTNRLAQILAEHPGITAQEAIRILLEQHTVVLGDLKNSVQAGRWMVPRGLVGQATGEVTDVSGVTQETYMDADACRKALEVSPDGRSIRPRAAPGTGGGSVVWLMPRHGVAAEHFAA
jgi:hypothetical protein